MAKKTPKKVQEIRDWKVEREAGSRSISFSQLSIYRACPHAWYKAYVLNEAPYIPSIHTAFGTAFHETVQTWLDKMYNESIKAADELDLEELLLNNLRTVYANEKKNYGKDFSSPEELGSFYQEGLEILKYIKKHRKAYFNPGQEWLVGCEIPLLYKLQDKFYFKGFIDILTYDEKEDIWKIWDIKTSTSGWNSTTKADKIKTDQVLLYKHFLSQEFGIDPDKIEVEYFIVKRVVPENPEYAAMGKRVQEFSPASGKVSVKKAVTEVDNFCKAVLSESKMEATPSTKACKWCLFKSNCEFAM